MTSYFQTPPMKTRSRSRSRALVPTIATWHASLHSRPHLGLVVWLLFLSSLFGVPVHAQDEALPESQHAYIFGQTATFTLRFPVEPALGTDQDGSAKEDAISEVTFYLNADHTESRPAVLSGPTATITRDLAATPITPYADVTYWWTYRQAGQMVETDRQSFRYVDNRYEWQTARQNDIQIHWVAGDREEMIQALDVAQAALARIGQSLQFSVPRTADIFIYPSQPDLASAMQLAGRSWAGAVAYPELSVILVAVPPTTEGLLTMDRDIPHELTHKAIYDLLGEQGYAMLPTWLSEGLAVYFEARPDPSHALTLDEARQTGTLIPLSELCAPFPDDPASARLAYAQSGSLINYLRQHYGWSTVRELMQAYADGMACGTGVQGVLDTDLAQLDRAWRVWLEQEQEPGSASTAWVSTSVLLRDAGPWLILLGILLLPIAFFVITQRR